MKWNPISSIGIFIVALISGIDSQNFTTNRTEERRQARISSNPEYSVGFQPSTSELRQMLSSYYSSNNMPLESGTFESPKRKLDTTSAIEILTLEPPKVIELYASNGTLELNRGKLSPYLYQQPLSYPHPLIRSPTAAVTGGVTFPSDSLNEVKSNEYGYPLTQHHSHPNEHFSAHSHSGRDALHHPHQDHTQTFLPDQHPYDHNEPGFAPVVSRALQFWLPAALLLTGASVLFPNRVKVPTNPEDVRNRPKRSTHYVFMAGEGGNDSDKNYEGHPDEILHSEHHTDNDGNYFNVPHVQNYESHRITESHGEPAGERDRKTQRHDWNRFSGPTESQENLSFGKEVGYDTVRHQKSEPLLQTHDSDRQIDMPKISETVKPSPGFEEYIERSSIISKKSKPRRRKLRVLLRARKNNAAPPPSTSTRISRPTPKIFNFKSNDTGKQGRKLSSYSKDEDLELPSTNKLTTKIFPLAPSLVSKTTVGSLSQEDPTKLLHLNESDLSNQKLIYKKVKPTKSKDYDLSPTGPVMSLLSSAAKYENESEDCQKRALCELAIRGTNPNATKFETFMWTLATLVPDSFTTLYRLEDTFEAIRIKNCSRFECENPNLDIQE